MRTITAGNAQTAGTMISTRRRAVRAMTALAALVLVLELAGCAPTIPPGTRDCIGFPAEVCQDRVAELEAEGLTHGGLAGYRMVCTAATCTAASGEGTEAVVFGDGTHREGGFGYATPGDAPAATVPPLTVVPQCLGVPATWCTDLAQTAAADAAREGGSVESVDVACTAICTAADGKGETRVTMSDGRVSTTAWQYQSSSAE